MTFLWIFNMLTSYCWPGSSVSIATELRAGWSGDRIPVGGEIFRTCPDWPWGPPSLLYSGYRVFSRGKEWPGRDADPSPPSRAVGHERVKLYLYSLYGPYGLYRASVSAQGWPLLYLYLLPQMAGMCDVNFYEIYIRHVYKLHVFIAAIHWYVMCHATACNTAVLVWRLMGFTCVRHLSKQCTDPHHIS
jgi:hypothetical protein